MAKGIRSYGPGKFSTIIDGYAFDVGLDGIDEEESYPEGGGWYGLLRLDSAVRKAIYQTAKDAVDTPGEYNPALTRAEEDLVEDSKAIIFFERSDGIVETDWFSDLGEAEDEWADIQKEFDEMEGDEE